MKITRKIADGTVKFGETPTTQTTMTITLTDAEIQEAYNELLKKRCVRDTRLFLRENYEGEFSEEMINDIANEYWEFIDSQINADREKAFDDVMEIGYPEYERRF